MKDLIQQQHFTADQINYFKQKGPWSCDNFVYMPDVSAEKAVVLAKNSDRIEFDTQPLMYYPHQVHSDGAKLKLGNITIDQVKETYEHLGSSPYWCWGYEQGINVHGVAIGNEAIFTKDVLQKQNAIRRGEKVPLGLIGMELVRLGLERAKTAKEAVEVITDLIAEHGQFSSGGPSVGPEDGAYNNSFIIADRTEAYVLETIDRHYAAKRITEGTAAISNEPSIRTKWDLSSDGITDYAIENGWWNEADRDTFDFAKAFLNFERPLQLSHIRVQRINQLIRQQLQSGNKMSLDWSKRILRDHYEDTFLEGPYFNAALPDFLTICMHHSPAEFTWGNTASSSLFVLPKEENRFATMWWLAGVPCTGVYIPFYVEAGPINPILSQAGTFGKQSIAAQNAGRDTYKEGSFWWMMRDLLDTAKGNAQGDKFNIRQPVIRRVFDDLEQKWALQAKAVEQKAALLKSQNDQTYKTVLHDFTEQSVQEAIQTIKTLKDIILKI